MMRSLKKKIKAWLRKHVRKDIRLLSILILLICFIVFIKASKFFDENGYIKAVIGIIFIVYMLYEGIYKRIKIDNKKEDVKKAQVTELLSRLDEFTPKINPSVLPNELMKFTPIIEKWGVDNKILRNMLYEKSSNKELKELKTIELHKEAIEKWMINNPEKREEVNAFKLTQKAYADLGLWTWEVGK